MSNKNMKKISIIFSGIILAFYILFLVLPFILSNVLNGYSPQISKMIEESSGFEVKIEKMQLITTPKLTAGLKINKAEAFLPNGEKFFQADNLQTKLSLLPLFLRKIEVDIVSADNIFVNLKIRKDGSFLIEKYIPEKKAPISVIKEKPFFKLSNRLPDIVINSHKIIFVDMATNKKYSISGEHTKISDFVLDEKIKISGKGQMVLDDKEQFKYDIKLFNKIMPDVKLNDLVFNPQPIQKKPQPSINLINIFKTIYKNGFNAHLKADVKTYGTFDDVRVDGIINVDKLSLLVNGVKLPDSYAYLKLKGNKIAIDSDLYTASNEITHLIGNFKTGKKPNVDMTFKSNADLGNILEIIKSVAESFGISDLRTLSAKGAINADFNIKSNLKKVQSSGYLKIPNGNLKYGLYNVQVSNINSDISLDNNIINIKKAGLSVMGYPLNIYGTVKQDATADLHLIANKLSVKSILLSLGQIGLLKDNVFRSGILSANASLNGRLDKPNAIANISISNVNLKNIPSASSVLMSNLGIKIQSDNKLYKGNVNLNGLKILNPAAVVSMPRLTAIIQPKEIIINPANVAVDRIKLIISGKITDYLTNNVSLNILTNGNIKSTLKGQIHPTSQKLNLNYSMPDVCTMPIPGFANSKLQAKGNLSISGPMMNPNLKGSFAVPFVLMPEMLVSLSDMTIKLNGPILRGTGTLQRLTSGNIVAENLSADYLLKGDLFHISNIKGNAYNGVIKGNVDYNIINGKIKADIAGNNINATPAIAATAGIKDALSGTLSFAAKVSLSGTTYENQVKTLKGKFSFSIDDGALGKMGRLENFLNAKNILANAIMRTALGTITTLSTIKNTANFKYIKGDMTFNNGWANISSIKVSGNTMSYCVKGRCNILSGASNFVILGRLSSDVVDLLGPIGDLSVDKLTSYIPKFGALTAVIIKSMTTSPSGENIYDIPLLANGDKNYKDFKVVYDGSIKSVKSFKWLSDVDTSAIDIKGTIKDVKKQFEDVRKSTIKDVKKQYSDVKSSTVNEFKGTLEQTKKELQNTTQEWKNLLKF